MPRPYQHNVAKQANLLDALSPSKDNKANYALYGAGGALAGGALGGIIQALRGKSILGGLLKGGLVGGGLGLGAKGLGDWWTKDDRSAIAQNRWAAKKLESNKALVGRLPESLEQARIALNNDYGAMRDKYEWETLWDSVKAPFKKSNAPRLKKAYDTEETGWLASLDVDSPFLRSNTDKIHPQLAAGLAANEEVAHAFRQLQEQYGSKDDRILTEKGTIEALAQLTKAYGKHWGLGNTMTRSKKKHDEQIYGKGVNSAGIILNDRSAVNSYLDDLAEEEQANKGFFGRLFGSKPTYEELLARKEVAKGVANKYKRHLIGLNTPGGTNAAVVREYKKLLKNYENKGEGAAKYKPYMAVLDSNKPIKPQADKLFNELIKAIDKY